MRKPLIFAILLSFLLGTGSISAFERAPKVIEAVDSVRHNFQRIKTIQGKIKRKLSLNEQSEESEGFFVQEVPHKVNLEYTTAPRQKVITDGQTLWIYSFEQKEVVRFDNLTKEELTTMQRFDFNYLLDQLMDSPEYQLEVFSQAGSEVVLAATPSKVNPLVSRILIKIDTEHGKITAYETFTASDDLTNQIKLEEYREYEGDIYYPSRVVVKSILGPAQIMTQVAQFQRLSFNQQIDSSNFQFSVPAEVKVITRAQLQERLQSQQR